MSGWMFVCFANDCAGGCLPQFSLWLAALICLPVQAAEPMDPAAAGPQAATNGPTIQLNCNREQSPGNPVADFMYFVPLISPEPVSTFSSAGSAQWARATSVTRRFRESSFVVTCDFAFTGKGLQESIFDLSGQIRQHEGELKKGGSLDHQLKAIAVEGPGAVTMEVGGTISNGVRTVTKVSLRFNAHGQASPVSIDLCDIRRIGVGYRPANEVVARVNTLTFRRQSGPPKMEVTIASIKDKGAEDGVWQTVKGAVKGAAANLLIDPLTIEGEGHRAMLDFGLAVVSESPSFTFPLARNLRAGH